METLINIPKRAAMVLLALIGSSLPAVAHAEVCDKVADSGGGVQLLLVLGSLVGSALAAWRPISGAPFIVALGYLAWIQAGDPVRPYAELEGCSGSLDASFGLTCFGLALVVFGTAIGCYARWRVWADLSRSFPKSQQLAEDTALEQ